MTTSVDGRATRWAQHNAERRRELVEATLRAIRKHGHGIGMADLSLFRFARKSWYGIASAAGMFIGHFMAWIAASTEA